MTKKSTLFIISFILWSWFSLAQIPEGYYDDAIGLSGEELKSALHNIIKNHEEYSYNDLRDFILKDTDEDPANSNNVILIHSGISRSKSDFGGNSGQWNREHVWAKSHGDFGDTPPAGTDAHHIRPSDVQVNSTRGNLDYDNGGSPVSNCPGCKKDGDSFETRDGAKGDVARMLFYMAVRYEGGNGEPDLEVVDEVNTSPAPEHGKLSTLLQWHILDPPDDFEKNRNDVIYSYQENRNPFIDHPEFVEEIWGDPTDISDNPELFLSVYPNPASSTLTLETQQRFELNYTLYQATGVKTAFGSLNHEKTDISISDFPAGLYFLVVSDESGKPINQYKILKINK